MRELIVVVPVYNEAGCIDAVLREWTALLDTLEVDYEIRVYNDGSRDRTADCLQPWERHPRVRVVHKTNEGHGPTIHRGYREAAAEAEWIFQMDGDGEMPASAFPGFWRDRQQAEGLFGQRTGRQESGARRLISGVSRAVVRFLAGGGVADVNVPYRLIRARCLAALLPRIPASTFAPNLAISGLMGRGRCRILNRPVLHQGRKTGAASLVKWTMWRAAVRSFVETTRLLWRNRTWHYES